jgi:hypothetical protein
MGSPDGCAPAPSALPTRSVHLLSAVGGQAEDGLGVRRGVADLLRGEVLETVLDQEHHDDVSPTTMEVACSSVNWASNP